MVVIFDSQILGKRLLSKQFISISRPCLLLNCAWTIFCLLLSNSRFMVCISVSCFVRICGVESVSSKWVDVLLESEIMNNLKMDCLEWFITLNIWTSHRNPLWFGNTTHCSRSLESNNIPHVYNDIHFGLLK